MDINPFQCSLILPVTKKHKNRLPRKLGFQQTCLEPLKRLQGRDRELPAFLTQTPSQASGPFSGPGQDVGSLPRAGTFLEFLPSLSSCCRSFPPVLIYSLLFLKYTQRPLACQARHPQNIQPKPQVHTNQALWDPGQANRNGRP